MTEAHQPGPRRSSSVVTTALGVGLATGTYGVSFGALSTASGLSVLQTCLLSLLVFTGASQFAFVGVVAGGGSPLTGSVTAILLGSRNLFYGASLATTLRWHGWRRWAGAHLVIDESTAVALAQDSTTDTRRGFVWTGMSVLVLWNAFTLVGALAGTAIGDPRDFGLDAAVGAAFLALLWPRLTSRTSWTVAFVGAAAATALVPLSPAGVPIIVGGAIAVALGLVLTRTRPGPPSTGTT